MSDENNENNENTNTSRDLTVQNPPQDSTNNNTNSDEKGSEKQRAEWTFERDLIYMKGLVECYPPSQGHGNVTKAWKDLQTAVNSVDQSQGQLKTTTLKCRGAVLIEEYKERQKRQLQGETESSENYMLLDEWIAKYIILLQGIAEKKARAKAKAKGKEKENSEKLSEEGSLEESSLAESSTASKRPAIDDAEEDNAKRTRVNPDDIISDTPDGLSLDQSLNLKILNQLTRHTEAVKNVQSSMMVMTKTLENGFQNLNRTLNILVNAMAKSAPPPPPPPPSHSHSRRQYVPIPIQKKTDNNTNNNNNNNNNNNSSNIK